MNKLILFGSEGTSGKLIREWHPKAVRVDREEAADCFLDYRREHFESAVIRILEDERPDTAIVASGLNPTEKSSALSFDKFSLDSALINFIAPFLICKQLVRHAVKQIIVFTSAAGATAPAGCAEYAAWKGALNAAILSLANEVGADHHINLYSPGASPSNPNLQTDINSILSREEGGFFYVRYETHFIKLPLGNLCFKVGLKTELFTSDTTSHNLSAGK